MRVCISWTTLYSGETCRSYVTGRRLRKQLAAAFPREVEAQREQLDRAVDMDLAYMHRTYRANATGGPGRALGASLRPDEVPF